MKFLYRSPLRSFRSHPCCFAKSLRYLPSPLAGPKLLETKRADLWSRSKRITQGSRKILGAVEGPRGLEAFAK